MGPPIQYAHLAERSHNCLLFEKYTAEQAPRLPACGTTDTHSLAERTQQDRPRAKHTQGHTQDLVFSEGAPDKASAPALVRLRVVTAVLLKGVALALLLPPAAKVYTKNWFLEPRSLLSAEQASKPRKTKRPRMNLLSACAHLSNLPVGSRGGQLLNLQHKLSQTQH